MLKDTYAYRFSTGLSDYSLEQLHKQKFMMDETLKIMTTEHAKALFFADFSVLIINETAHTLELVDPDSAMQMIMNQHPFVDKRIHMIPEHLLDNPH